MMAQIICSMRTWMGERPRKAMRLKTTVSKQRAAREEKRERFQKALRLR